MKKRSKYYIDLTMQSAAGTFTVKPRIVTGPPKKPSAPKVTSATPAGKQVTIAWAPPTFNGYSYLKGYGARLYSKKKGGSVEGHLQLGTVDDSVHDEGAEEEGHLLLGRPGQELQGLVELVEASEGGRPVAGERPHSRQRVRGVLAMVHGAPLFAGHGVPGGAPGSGRGT